MPAADPVVAERLRRLFRVVSGLLTVAAVVRWLTPVNVPSANLQPYGCGSPASPTPDSLSELVCKEALGAARGWVLALVIAAILVLAIGELAARPLAGRPWLMASLAIAVPIAVLAVVSLFLPVVAHGADGTKFACGTAVSPVTDPFFKGLCANLPETRKSLALGWLLGAAAFVAGGAYLGSTGLSKEIDPMAEPETAAKPEPTTKPETANTPQPTNTSEAAIKPDLRQGSATSSEKPAP